MKPPIVWNFCCFTYRDIFKYCGQVACGEIRGKNKRALKLQKTKCLEMFNRKNNIMFGTKYKRLEDMLNLSLYITSIYYIFFITYRILTVNK